LGLAGGRRSASDRSSTTTPSRRNKAVFGCFSRSPWRPTEGARPCGGGRASRACLNR
jgi:hypothetical protein